MTINKEKIREALDLFQDDKYLECRAVLKEEIKNYKQEYLNNLLGISEEEDLENLEESENLEEVE